ncbi:MAG: hypothetical protein B7Y53_01185 [Halothiobacillus sp. 28-55-5]|nr:MAG: hypothetical protein B7Y53_01185 [Halothiobacillus sp. 28-55-5]
MSFADLPPKNRPSAPPRNAALPAFCTPRVLLITLLLGFGVALLLAIAPGVAANALGLESA